MSKKIGTHTFVFNPQENGGEALILTTEFYDNGDGELFTTQKLTLESYGNEASLGLFKSPIQPEKLRILADELLEKEIEVVSQLKMEKENDA